MAALGHKDIGGLNVAVDDPFGMCGVQCVGNFNRQTDQEVALKGLSVDTMLQCRTVQKLHGDEWLAVFLADFIDGADVGMVQGGGCLSFALEAGQGQRIFDYVIRQKLQGDKSVKTDVLGLVDNAHATAAQLLDDAVVRDDAVDH
jgi:hypothetical protein